MNAEQIRDLDKLVDGMTEPDGTIDTFIMSDVVKRLASHSAAMAMPIVGALEPVLRELSKSGPLTTDRLSAWSVETGDPFYKAFAMRDERAGNAFLFAIQMDGKVDEAFEKIMAKVVPGRQEPVRLDAPVESAAIERIGIYEIGESVEAAVRSFVRNKWSPDTIVETRDGLDRLDGEWFESTPSGSYFDFTEPMHLLNYIVFDDAFGLDMTAVREAATRSLEEYRRRVYTCTSDGEPSLAKYSASFRVASYVRDMEDRLPAGRAVDALDHIQSRAMEADLNAHLSMLREIREMAIEGNHRDLESEFEFNDLDDFVFTVDEPRPALYFRDQNTVQVVQFLEGSDRIRVLSARRDYEDDEDHQMPAAITAALRDDPQTPWTSSFTMRDGRYVLDAPFGGKLDDIRSWNSLVFVIGSAHCCMREEIRNTADSPVP